MDLIGTHYEDDFYTRDVTTDEHQILEVGEFELSRMERFLATFPENERMDALYSVLVFFALLPIVLGLGICLVVEALA